MTGSLEASSEFSTTCILLPPMVKWVREVVLRKRRNRPCEDTWQFQIERCCRSCRLYSRRLMLQRAIEFNCKVCKEGSGVVIITSG